MLSMYALSGLWPKARLSMTTASARVSVWLGRTVPSSKPDSQPQARAVRI